MSAERRLLVVDDEESNRSLLRTFFSKKGFVVSLAEDGEQALSMVADADVVLLDLMMPGIDGLEVLRRLRLDGCALPVVLLTAVTSPEAVVAAMQAGAQDYVTKPFSLPVLLTRVQRVLDEAQPAQDVGDVDVVEVKDERVVLAPALPAEPPNDTAKHVAPLVIPRSPTDSLPGLSLFSRLKRAISSDVAPAELARGTVLSGRYRLSEPIGAGAFGAVWRARHVELDVDVAVKILHRDAPPIRPGETALASFRKEAMLAARLTTPHAVRVHDFSVTETGHAFLVMELLKGESLRQRLAREHTLSIPVACGSVADVCDALAAAHRHGVVHRDVKALNVFVAEVEDDGPRTTIKLIDFGAAGSRDDDRTGAVLVGTPSHMAPERFLDPRGTPASDVYAAGVMLFQLLTGAVPFGGDDIESIARLHKDSPVPLPSARRPGLEVCDEVVLATLAKVPARRPTAKALATWLRQIARRQSGSRVD